jgi:hypothetical protein
MSRLISNRRTIAGKRGGAGGAGGITITPYDTITDLVTASADPAFADGYYIVGGIVYVWTGAAFSTYPMPEPTLDVILEAVGVIAMDVYATQITIAADAAFIITPSSHTDMDAGTAWGAA